MKTYCKYSISKAHVFIACIIFIMNLFSCNKYLDKKPSPSVAEPNSVSDLKAMLDNNSIMNYSTTPSLLELSADNYYVTTENWHGYDTEGNYNWSLTAVHEPSWMNPYTQSIYYANIVLDHLPKIHEGPDDEVNKDYVRGAALFYRAFAFFQLAQVYCKPYSSSSNKDLGIVLRSTSAIESPSTRATVLETYNKIIDDIKIASELLPDNSRFFFQPNRCAAFGLLARVYLSMREYVDARKYADLALEIKSDLLDFNSLLPAGNSPFFNRDNPEIIFFNTAANHALLDQTVGIIDSTLLGSYDINDIRKQVYFRLRSQKWRFKGSYAAIAGGTPAEVFDGIATDELFLIRAEANARIGEIESAMSDLNHLLKFRWLTGEYVNLETTDQKEAIKLILKERRKELLYRGARWADIRRLNLDGANITLTRLLDNVTYSLPPNDLRSIALIPWDEINLSGIIQNPR